LGVAEVSSGDAMWPIVQYQLIYDSPHNLYRPATLCERLTRQLRSLDDKIQLATALARGVASVHGAGFVHKNLRPETILILRDRQNDTLTAYLVGFERFRNRDAGSTCSEDDAWRRNVYRHPQRHSDTVEHQFIVQHDIYSLDVCLLEIGMWRSFILRENPSRADPCLQIPQNKTQNKDVELYVHRYLKGNLMELCSKTLPPRNRNDL
jgi:hypothetical protein